MLQVVPRVIVFETEDMLKGLFQRYVDGVEIVSVHDIEQVECELSRAPAQALIVNASPFGKTAISEARLANLPFDTPVVTCWVPGLDEAARQLGVVRYLVKPVTTEILLASLDELGGRARTILLVDDSSEVLQLFTRMLASEEHGYRVLQTTSGRRALSLLRERRPDVMFLDLFMPDMDGFEVLHEKSQDPTIRDIPVIVISSRDPAGEPVVSDTLTITQGSGLSVRDILACIQAVSTILSPSAESDRRGFPKTSAAQPAYG
jgi:CheY-like chemotaxis protein